jgi:predicted Zn-dependent peptidase
MASARLIAPSALIAVLGGTVALSALKQAPAQPMSPPGKNVVLKGLAPVSTEILKVTLPRPAEADLDNGVHLMVLEDHRAPQVTFLILVPGAGGYYDPADAPGLATVTAAMMREGTTGRSTLQIAELLERNASFVNVATGMSSVDGTLSGSALTENFEPTLSLAADILLNPSFPDEELTRYKERTRTGLIQQRTNAGFLASEMFSRVVYGSHPASRIALTAPVLDKVTRAMLADFHRSHYVPDHAVMAFAGDVSMAKVRKTVEDAFKGWKKSGVPSPAVAEPPPPGASGISFVARPNSVQTNLVVGAQSINRTSPDYDSLQLMNDIIGGGPAGRLFMVLREEKGYTYGAYSGLSASKFRGTWSANTEVRNSVTEDAFKDLMAQIARMRDEAIPDRELQAKKRKLIASFALSLEFPQAVLNNHITRYIYKLPMDYWDRYPERVAAITQSQVQQAARKYLDPARLQIVVVGDPGLADVLKKYGKVETYDTEGKVVGTK